MSEQREKRRVGEQSLLSARRLLITASRAFDDGSSAQQPAPEAAHFTDVAINNIDAALAVVGKDEDAETT